MSGAWSTSLCAHLLGWDAGRGRRRRGLHSLRLTQSTTLLPRLPDFPPQAFPTAISPHAPFGVAHSQQQTSPGIAPQSLSSSAQPLAFEGVCVPVGSTRVWLRLSGRFSFRWGCRRSAYTLGLKWCSSDPNSAPMWEVDPSFSSPPAEGRSTSISSWFSPGPLVLPSFAWFYMFFSRGHLLCLPSSGVLKSRLCLKVYSWRTDVLHDHLLLHLLVPPPYPLCFNRYFSWPIIC